MLTIVGKFWCIVLREALVTVRAEEAAKMVDFPNTGLLEIGFTTFHT